MANYVQKFSSTDLNAPPLTGQAGALLKVLNAALVDGYGYSGVSITSITRVGTVATATCSAADMLRLQTGAILTISGAAQTDYNITAAITVASTTTFTYTVANSPVTPATGTLVFSTFLPVTGITRVGNIALVQLANPNATLLQNDYLKISGAGQSDYNVTAVINVAAAWVANTAYALGALTINNSNLYICRTAGTSAASGGPTTTATGITDNTCTWDYIVASSSSASYFSYSVANSPTTPATGTIVYTKAGLQWTRPFVGGTNSQSYRSADASSNQLYLQVIDNAATAGAAKEAQAYGAEVLTADNTPNNGGGANTGRFPTTVQLANGVCWTKSATADTTVRPWQIWGDDRTFYLRTMASGSGTTTAYQAVGFGHFLTEKSGDGYNTFICGCSAFNTTSSNGGFSSGTSGTLSQNTTGVYVPRVYTQLGSAVSAGLCYPSLSMSTLPNPVNTGVYCSPMFISDTANTIRGRLPGIYGPWFSQTSASLVDGDVWSSLTNLSGVTLHTLIGQSAGSGFACLIDRYGPWT